MLVGFSGSKQVESGTGHFALQASCARAQLSLSAVLPRLFRASGAAAAQCGVCRSESSLQRLLGKFYYDKHSFSESQLGSTPGLVHHLKELSTAVTCIIAKPLQSLKTLACTGSVCLLPELPESLCWCKAASHSCFCHLYSASKVLLSAGRLEQSLNWSVVWHSALLCKQVQAVSSA